MCAAILRGVAFSEAVMFRSYQVCKCLNCGNEECLHAYQSTFFRVPVVEASYDSLISSKMENPQNLVTESRHSFFLRSNASFLLLLMLMLNSKGCFFMFSCLYITDNCDEIDQRHVLKDDS